LPGCFAPFVLFALLGLGSTAACVPKATETAAPATPAPTSVAPIHLEIRGFAPDERARILQAAEDWNATGFARFDLAPGGWKIVRSDARLPQFAVTNTAAREVMVYRSAPSDLRGIMRHELGHVLGLDHTASGLMSPRYDQRAYSRIDSSTLKTLARLEAKEPLPNAVATEGDAGNTPELP
jgi:hypothetical protein